MSDANPPVDEPTPTADQGGISITTTVLIIGALLLAWYAYRKFSKE